MTSTIPAGSDRKYELAVEITAPVPTPEQIEAREIAESLRDLADLVLRSPTVASVLQFALRNLLVPLNGDEENRDTFAAVAKDAASFGAKVKKGVSRNDAYFELHVTLNRVHFKMYADRDKICERVVTGTREVTEEVPDPEALAAVPKVTVTKTVEDVEWVCRPLLAEETSGSTR